METAGLSASILLLYLSAACAELQVSVVSPQMATLGSDALLECTFTVGQPSVNVKHLAVVWSLDGKDLLRFGNGLKVLEPRASIDEAKIPTGNASLVLSKVTVADEGTYRCLIIYSPEKRQMDVTLNLQAPPEIISPEQTVIEGRENLLRCSVVGFYPMEIDVSWLRDGEILPGSSMSKPQLYAKGTFMINSTAPLVPTVSDARRNFSCRVLHSSLRGPLQEDVRLLIKEEERGGVNVTALVLSLLVILVIVAVLGWFLYRRLTHIKLCKIQGPATWTLGERVELSCVGHHCPKGTEVRWIKIHDGNETEIEASADSEQQHTKLLLKQEGYTVQTTKASEGHGYETITSTLHITPSVEEHEGAVFRCHFHTKDGRTKAEKQFQALRVQGKPQAAQTIKRSPLDDINMLCSLELQSFYPKEIQIQWSCGAVELQDVASEEQEAENASHQTFNIRTECKIPIENFTDPNFRIRVTWKHASLEVPAYKEMSVANSAVPRLGEMKITPSEKGVILTLDVTSLYPKTITVEWSCDLPGKVRILPSCTEQTGGSSAGTYSVRSSCELLEVMIRKIGAACINATIGYESCSGETLMVTRQLIRNDTEWGLLDPTLA